MISCYLQKLVGQIRLKPNEEWLRLKDVIECGVIGVDDSNRGESIHLFVVKSSDDLAETDIISYCKKGLTIYKVPKKVFFIKEMPKNNVGKTLRSFNFE